MLVEEFIEGYIRDKFDPDIVKDYIVNYDDITKEFIVDLWIKPPKPIYFLKFITNADGNIEFLEEGEEDACKG